MLPSNPFWSRTEKTFWLEPPALTFGEAVLMPELERRLLFWRRCKLFAELR